MKASARAGSDMAVHSGPEATAPPTNACALAARVLVVPCYRAGRVTNTPDPTTVLWYSRPADAWLEALPVGNGRLGAMVFGGVGRERIQLNEETVWAGSAWDATSPEALEALPDVRRLLFEGKPAEAFELTQQKLMSRPLRMPPYQTLGDLCLEFDAAGEAEVPDYRRELDVDAGIVRVSYVRGGVRFTREVFASVPDQLLVIRLTASRPGALSFRLGLTREADAQAAALSSTEMALRGACDGGAGVQFDARVSVRTQGGVSKRAGETLRIEGATECLLLLTAATSLNGADPGERNAARLAAARMRPYEALRLRHVNDHRALFRRVRLDLGATEPALAALPTDERLSRLQAGGDDPQLVTLYFNYGRDLLMASSRPGCLPATLQGIWNDSLKPPWESKYTININIQMHYWPAEVTNLAECHGPLLDLVEALRESGRHTARVHYGARGFVAHHNTDAWRHTAPVDGPRSGMWPLGAAWLALHLWEHYAYGLDRGFLRERAYPVLKEAAEFFLDYLVEHPHYPGTLVTGPSVSPENRHMLLDGTVGALCMGPAMDTQILRELFDRVTEAAALLGVDEAFPAEIAAVRAKLPAERIGRHGQLQEWLEDYDEHEPGHRHISHLFALHPAAQITPRGTPELARAARVSLERRLAAGSGQTGWSRAWVANFWARLEEGDLAHEHLIELLRGSTAINLMDLHPPHIFQLDGNLGGVAAVAEMLVQSHSGELHLLPALPRAWPTGSVTGLRARGGYGVDLWWEEGKLTRAVIRAAADGQCRVRTAAQVRTVDVRAGAAYTFEPDP